MKVSVAIPLYNAESWLEKQLVLLKRQNLKVNEWLLVDSSSTDATPEILNRNRMKYRTIKPEAFDHGGTRNEMLNSCRSDIIIFMTQDALPGSEDCLSALVQPFRANDNLAACFGRQLPHENASVFARHLRAFNYPAESYERNFTDFSRYGIKTAFLSNSFCAYRVKYLKKCGGFRPKLIMGEDAIAAADLLKAGFTLRYESRAMVHHSHDYSIRQDFRRYFDIGVFHHREPELLRLSGSAGGEGLRYLKSELRYLMKEKKFFKLPEFCCRMAAKLAGYRLGLQENRLPLKLRIFLSMHRRWWSHE